jgi:putative ABC transport system ATP-binding protein
MTLREVCVEVPDGLGTRVLLDHVDLEVRPGEVVVVTGGSGAGKSTLLAVAGLLRRPLSGEVIVGDVPASALSERRRAELRKHHVAIVYQAGNLLPSLTSREQLEIVGHISGASRVQTRRRADALLRELGLLDAALRLPAHLSGGERQRVGIARALMGQPSVLLADEPTASLDAALSAEVVALLTEHTRRAQLATVIVSHDTAPLSRADRHQHLAGGKLERVATMPR